MLHQDCRRFDKERETREDEDHFGDYQIFTASTFESVRPLAREPNHLRSLRVPFEIPFSIKTKRTTKVTIRMTMNMPGRTINHLSIRLRLAAKTKTGMVIAYWVVTGDLVSSLRQLVNELQGREETDEGEENSSRCKVGVVWDPAGNVQVRRHVGRGHVGN